MEAKKFLEIKNLCKSFSNKQIINNLNLTIYKNKIHTILGPSGSGKTTLLNIIAGLKKQDSGELIFNEDKNISYIFQEDRLLKWKTIYKNIELVVKDKLSTKDIKKEIEYYLSIMDLLEYKDNYPNELSGGMRQRVSAIRAFIYPSHLLLMDEPFKSLDIKIKIRLMETVIKLWEKKPKTIIFVTHSSREALFMSHYIHILSNSPTKIIMNYNIDKDIINRNIMEDYFLNLEKEIFKLSV